VVEKLATACEKFVCPGQTEQPFLLHQPCDGSVFDTLITSETISSQVVLQGVKQISTAGCHIQTLWGIIQCFETKYLQHVPGLLACVWLGTVMEEKHTITTGTRNFSPAHQWIMALNCCNSASSAHMPQNA
jgi:hypothetical protein